MLLHTGGNEKQNHQKQHIEGTLLKAAAEMHWVPIPTTYPEQSSTA